MVFQAPVLFPWRSVLDNVLLPIDVQGALPSVEPLAVGRPQGIKAKTFYTVYQGNIYGIAVPADSPVQKFTDLRGKTIGVIAMGSAGVLIARALAATKAKGYKAR